MDLYNAHQFARQLMNQYGLHDWTFAFDHAKRRFGSCRHHSKRITLSRMLTFLNTDRQVRDTILHEIAHALTIGHGHDSVWKAMCIRLGANPQRCYSADEVASPASRPAR